jgi:hypothetical protein
VSVRLSSNRQNRCRLTEEAHQSLDVLSYCCQEELLAHEPESPQTQASQSDLILQFREQSFRPLSLPLCFGELWRVDQLPRALSSWFVLVDDKAPEGSTGALCSERARATLFAGPDIVEGSIAMYTSGNCTQSVCPYSLFDFFNFNQTPRTFNLIQGAKYDTGDFLNPGAYFPSYPSDPDDDAIDND